MFYKGAKTDIVCAFIFGVKIYSSFPDHLLVFNVAEPTISGDPLILEIRNRKEFHANNHIQT
jgi:hypothetical protein